MNPRIIIHNVFLDEFTQNPSVRYTIEIPREDGISFVHGCSPVGDYIEIHNETN